MVSLSIFYTVQYVQRVQLIKLYQYSKETDEPQHGDDELSFRYVIEKMCNFVLKSIIMNFSITNQAQQDISELVMGILASS